MNSQLRAHLALGGVALIYGANYVIAKSIMPQPIPPSGFIVMRVVGAVLLFWIIKSYIRESVARKDMARLVLCGLTGVAINQILFFEGLNLTSPVNAAIIMTINPILVMVMAAVILKNRITKRKLAGVFLGAVGAITLILLSSTSPSLINSWKGDLFVLINATSYGIYLVAVKPLMSKYKPITVISWVFLFGTIFVIPVGAGDFLSISWSEVSGWQIASIVYVIVATTFLAYLLNIYALKKVQPTVSSAYIYLQPLIAGLFTWLFSLFTPIDFTSAFGWQQLVCALLIFGGVWLVSTGSVGAAKTT